MREALTLAEYRRHEPTLTRPITDPLLDRAHRPGDSGVPRRAPDAPSAADLAKRRTREGRRATKETP